MGWNSWDCYGTGVSEDIVKANADYMAANLKKYGWDTVVVDIEWYAPEAKTHEYEPFAELCMDEYGRLMPAENKFPSAAGGRGFKPLADYIHSLGLKFGIHIMRGIPRQAVHENCPVYGSDMWAKQIAQYNNICEWNPDMYGLDAGKKGSEDYYNSIFGLYADWGVDFIKCDDICREMPRCADELRLISRAIDNCGREMVFSISPGPAKLEFAELYKQTSNMWRITDDFWDKWELLYAMFERAEKWSVHTGPGSFPDADMLPVGPILQDYDKANRTKFTRNEQYTMMTLWSIFRSPLFIGGDMTGFDDFTLSLVCNEGILNMHKNARNAHQVWRKELNGSEHILWTADSADGAKYLAVFNTSEKDSETTLSLSDIELYNGGTLTELWTGEEFRTENSFLRKIPSHGAAAFYITDF